MKNLLKLFAILILTALATGANAVSSDQIAAASPDSRPTSATTSTCQVDAGSGLPPLNHQTYLPLAIKNGGNSNVQFTQVHAVALNNLLANGSFETGDLSDWSAGGATASTAQAHSGNWSARIANNDMEAVVATLPGKTYKMTAWVKIVSETGSDWGGFRLEAISWDWNSLAHSGNLSGKVYGNAWFKVAVSFTATTNSTRIKAGYFGGSGKSMVVHFDDALVFEKSATNQLPVISAASLTPVSISNLPQTQNFSLTVDDPDGAVERVLWDFGDGTRSLSASGSHRAALPGAFAATVSVADDDGGISTQTIFWNAADPDFPTLSIADPALNGLTVSNAALALSGTAGGQVAGVQVSTDRGFVGAAGGTANWSATVPLKPGANRIVVQARGANGTVTTVERTVCFNPSGPLQISNVALASPSVEQWEMLEINFAVDNSAATYPQFPYQPTPAPGLKWLDGITVDGYFSADNWQTVYKRPAFLRQPFERAKKGNREWLHPTGNAVWTVRFAPPVAGNWQFYIDATEAKGTARSAVGSFAVTGPTSPNNRGPVAVSATDPRYFEFADGTPFLGTGHGTGFNADRFSYDAASTFDTIGAGNQQFFRWWVGGQIWGSAWQPWASRTLGYEATVPATGLTVERAYGNGLAALRLDAQNPIMFQGFQSGFAGLVPGRTYRAVVRWRTENVTGPQSSGKPYGVTLKLTGWPQVGGTLNDPALIPHVHGDTPWHVAAADFVANSDYIPYVSLILENSTGGAAYVDEVSVVEMQADGSVGPQILRSPRFNSHLTFDQRRGAGMDAIFTEATARDMFFKLVIGEKQEYLLNHFAPDGLPELHGNFFNQGAGSPTHQLHTAYWRHLLARFGAYRAIHSWELANEEAPGPGPHFQLTAELAELAAADGNPHPATTSTWATLAQNAWNAPESQPISYADFHAYVRGTGWIDPKNELANDSARFFHEYDLSAAGAGFGKPVVWGEQGIDDGTSTDNQEPLLGQDLSGVWLHKMTWARTGPGGVYPLYWYTNHIFDSSLHPIFGAWNRFMAGVPLTNGRYQDIAAATSHADLRAYGQKDVQAGQAHLWIDNKRHTWRAVVDGTSIPAVSGTVSIPMQRANQNFVVTWFNTTTGQPTGSQAIASDGGGTLILPVSNLATDIAAKISLP